MIKNLAILGLGGAAVYFWLDARAWAAWVAGNHDPWFQRAASGTPLAPLASILYGGGPVSLPNGGKVLYSPPALIPRGIL